MNGRKSLTYKLPKAKIKITPILCFNGSLKLLRTGIGMTKIATSVNMCTLALENQRAFLLKQKPPIEVSQNLATGIQLRNPLTTAQVP